MVLLVKNFETKNSRGLQRITITDLNAQNYLSKDMDITLIDLLLFYGKHSNPSNTAGWNGLMENFYKSSSFSVSKIITLPFVDAPPSNYDTVLTFLIEAAKRCSENKQQHCFVTFDQPLYLKAREIISSIDPNDDPHNLKCVIVRVGGFHALMSFLGSIGFIMDGSGLKEALSEIYSTDKALQGHVFSRALRGHQLVQIALASIIFISIQLIDPERELLTDLLTKIKSEDFNNLIQHEIFLEVKKNLNCISKN